MSCPVLVKFVISYNFPRNTGQTPWICLGKADGLLLKLLDVSSSNERGVNLPFSHPYGDTSSWGRPSAARSGRIQLSRAIARSRMLRVSFEL